MSTKHDLNLDPFNHMLTAMWPVMPTLVKKSISCKESCILKLLPLKACRFPDDYSRSKMEEASIFDILLMISHPHAQKDSRDDGNTQAKQYCSRYPQDHGHVQVGPSVTDS